MPRESRADKRSRTQAVIRLLRKEFPDARTRLEFRRNDPLHVLVATILSAQCTDDRVNLVTRDLFRKYTTAEDFSGASQKQLEEEIRTCGFYRNKANNIRKAARMIVEEYDGTVPDTMDELLNLPGVARKTANCVLSNAYGKNEGVVVDTHVKRVAGRLKLTDHSDPNKIERDLVDLVPRSQWGLFSHLLIFHGRAYCTARKPDCPNCPLAPHCPSAGKA